MWKMEANNDNRPTAPSPSDCCGSGCRVCILDVYEQKLAAWERQHQEGFVDNFVESVIKSTAYTDFLLIEILSVSDTTNLYRFQIGNNRCLDLKVGQHLVLKQIKDKKLVTREYTPVSKHNNKGNFDVLIKLYADGKMSQLVRRWSVGEKVAWRGPCGGLSYSRNQYPHIVMLGAGTGIAPLYQLIQQVLNDEEDDTRLKLLYASKCFSEILLREELREYCCHWNFNATHYLSDEGYPSSQVYGETVNYSRICENSLKTDIVDIPLSSSLFLVCGTEPFERDMKTYLASLTVPLHRVVQF